MAVAGDSQTGWGQLLAVGGAVASGWGASKGMRQRVVRPLGNPPLPLSKGLGGGGSQNYRVGVSALGPGRASQLRAGGCLPALPPPWGRLRCPNARESVGCESLCQG